MKYFKPCDLYWIQKEFLGFIFISKIFLIRRSMLVNCSIEKKRIYVVWDGILPLQCIMEAMAIYYMDFLNSSMQACTINIRIFQQSGVITALWLAPQIILLSTMHQREDGTEDGSFVLIHGSTLLSPVAQFSSKECLYLQCVYCKWGKGTPGPRDSWSHVVQSK